MEFLLAKHDIAVQYVNHYTTKILTLIEVNVSVETLSKLLIKENIERRKRLVNDLEEGSNQEREKVDVTKN